MYVYIHIYVNVFRKPRDIMYIQKLVEEDNSVIPANFVYKGLAKRHCSGVMGPECRDRCKPLKLTPNLPIGRWKKYGGQSLCIVLKPSYPLFYGKESIACS